MSPEKSTQRKVLNPEPGEEKPNNAPTTPAQGIEKGPLAPFDPRLRKDSSQPLQSNEDPLNGVNE